SFVCFLFQAEDGIRYATVTGVQTCALPISVFQFLIDRGFRVLVANAITLVLLFVVRFVLSDRAIFASAGQEKRRDPVRVLVDLTDRKSTRLNSSHGSISYAVFCLKKKTVRR